MNTTLSGVGIHSGQTCQITLTPTPSPSIRFQSTNTSFTVGPDVIRSAQRSTVIGGSRFSVQTPEHLLAACVGLGIWNITIIIDGPEVPIMDGSSLPFVTLLQDLTIRPQAPPPLVLDQAVEVIDGDASLIALPADETRFTYSLDHPGTPVSQQTETIALTPSQFISDIAPARTWGFRKDLDRLHQQGLAKGASETNTLVVEPSGYNTPLRLPNEPARHKILDLIGDLALLGRPINAHIIGKRSGHRMNHNLVQKLAKIAYQ